MRNCSANGSVPRNYGLARTAELTVTSCGVVYDGVSA
jgi:hypothetical protein